MHRYLCSRRPFFMTAMQQSLRISGISCVISSIGDILMQMRDGVRRPMDWDTRRTANLAGYRTIHGPIVDRCWRWFDARLPLPTPLVGAMIRAGADQCFLMPPSLIAFFVSQGLLEGLSLDESTLRAKEQLIPAAKIAIPFWLTVHTVTFAAFPPHLRMVWAQTCAVLWNALCSEQNQIARRRERTRKDRL